MPKFLLVSAFALFLFAGCSDYPEDSLLDISTSPVENDAASLNAGGSEMTDYGESALAGHYEQLNNPLGLSAAEYCIANNLTLVFGDTAMAMIARKPELTVDTLFAWRYQISDEVLPDQGTMRSRIVFSDGREICATYDFSVMQHTAGIHLLIYAPDRYGEMCVWETVEPGIW